MVHVCAPLVTACELVGGATRVFTALQCIHHHADCSDVPTTDGGFWPGCRSMAAWGLSASSAWMP
jgi:hypothetical protein